LSEIRSRVVLLGASNLRLALPSLVRTFESFDRSPMQVLVACGHGRSYGMTSRVLGVELPSIGTCGLWDALLHSPSLPTVALLTDVGNDIMYGASAGEISAWIARDIERLAALGARPLVVRLPLVTIERLSSWQYEIARSILYPTRRIPWKAARDSALELDRRLLEIAHEHDLPVVEPAADWYGFDPIHIRRERRASVWGEIVARLFEASPARAMSTLSGADRRSLARARPASRRVLGFVRAHAQPAAQLASGTTISLF
jgi:hypothetical protein